MKVELTQAVIDCLKRGLNCWPEQNNAEGAEIRKILEKVEEVKLRIGEDVLKHEQQIKDIAAHLLELKQLVTPMMEFKPEKSLQEPVAWLVERT